MKLNTKPSISVTHIIGLLLFTWTVPSLAADEHPDFSGVWDRYYEPGAGFGGFGGPQEDLPLTAEGQRRSAEYQQLVGPFQDNPGAFCVTYGMPAMMESVGGYPLEIIQRPEQITLIYEVEGETRRIFMDDNALPEERRFPNRQGYSAGHWEGDVLVVETTSLTDGQDQLAHPHSDQARITERFSLDRNEDNIDILSYEMSMSDPVYYTQPVTVSSKLQPLPNGQMLPYNCPEEPWLKSLEMRRQQLQAGEEVTATMADVYATEMYESE